MRKMFFLHGTIDNQVTIEYLASVTRYSKEKRGPYFEGIVNQMGKEASDKNNVESHTRLLL